MSNDGGKGEHHEQEEHDKGNHKLAVVMIVNGDPHEFTFALGQVLHAIVAETLAVC